MKIKTWHTLSALTALATVALAVGAQADSPEYSQRDLRTFYDHSVRYTNAIQFPQRVAGNVDLGRAAFGVNASDTAVDITSSALFTGPSVIFEGNVTSNGRACASCHHPERHFLLPELPLTSHVPANDPLITGITADAQGDPRAFDLFNELGLMRQRPGRFNVTLAETEPFRALTVWRKTQTIINMGFGFGLLTDGRARQSLEQSRAAAMAHTQPGDVRFDDLVNPTLPNISAYQESEFDPPELAALLDPTNPNYQTLVNDPFATVPVKTRQQHDGELVFAANCMTCHNMPNVFGNRDHVNGPPSNFPPLYGHTYDVGVAQKNALHLDYRQWNASTGTFSFTTLPLAREDGSIVNVKVVDDPGAAGATGRYEDLHRFKVPQLRDIKDLGPYFHDNSADSLEDVVDFFNSDDYNNSVDGQRNPIHLSRKDRSDLLAFLKIL
jgi:cytochrome c peroxidase